jgi:threonylcarbamoyladenosine tRNA methylthiotransferase MtaB
VNISFSIKTLGCKANQYESAVIASALENAGCVSAPFGNPVDIVIVNTCTVTDNSDKKCRNYIRQGAEFSNCGGVIVSGCLSRRDSAAIESMKEVLGIVDPSERKNLAERIFAAAGIHHLSGYADFSESGALPLEHTRAFLRIQDGCAGECSYCIVPSVRGKPVSRPLDDIVSHVEKIIRAGVNEIVLTGITIGSYNFDGKDIADCAKALCGIDGDFRIRITSIEPTHLTDKLLDVYASEKKICPHIHLPLQSGTDSVLSRMNRPYNTGQFHEKMNLFKNAVPGGAVGTDCIIGFPGETDDEFAVTLDFCREMKFPFIHQFTYSHRSGTVASKLKLVNGSVTAVRAKQMRELSRTMHREFAAGFIGKQVPSIAEKGGWALTPHYLKVYTGEKSVRKGIQSLTISGIDGEGVIQGKFTETIANRE